MRKKSIILILFILMIFSFSNLVFAHQPKIVEIADAEKGIVVQNPEISKAYYSELTGNPHYYIIDSKKEFPIYVGVLLPGKVLNYTLSFELTKNKVLLYSGNGENFSWSLFYENFGKDYYLAGPEYGHNYLSTHNVSAGVYTIKVFNELNLGKYALVIGDVEKFSIIDILRMLWITLKLKFSFF